MPKPDLRNIRILAEMTPAHLDALLKYGRVVEFTAGQTIVKQGSASAELFLVLEGKVGAFLDERHGNEIHLRTIETGGHFGEIGLLEGGKRTATVKALEPSRLFSLDAASFAKLLKEPGLAVPFLHGLSRSLAIRLTDMTNRVGELWAIKDSWAV